VKTFIKKMFFTLILSALTFQAGAMDEKKTTIFYGNLNKIKCTKTFSQGKYFGPPEEGNLLSFKACFESSKNLLCFLVEDGSVIIFDTRTGNLIKEFKVKEDFKCPSPNISIYNRYGDYIRWICFDQKGERLAIQFDTEGHSRNRTIKIYNTTSWSLIDSLEITDSLFYNNSLKLETEMFICPNFRYVVYRDNDKNIVVLKNVLDCHWKKNKVINNKLKYFYPE